MQFLAFIKLSLSFNVLSIFLRRGSSFPSSRFFAS